MIDLFHEDRSWQTRFTPEPYYGSKFKKGEFNMPRPRDANDYIILYDDDLVGLLRQVQTALRDGWHLAGGVSVAAATLSSGQTIFRFHQALCAPGRVG